MGQQIVIKTLQERYNNQNELNELNEIKKNIEKAQKMEENTRQESY